MMATYLDLLLSFFQIGILSFGGGMAALPLISQQVVDKHSWLTLGEFTDLITISEMTPGPIGINSSTFVGIRVAGVPGAVIAMIGYVLPACVLCGGVLLLVCDLVSQLPAHTLPINTVSALFGAPVIIWIILKRK